MKYIDRPELPGPILRAIKDPYYSREIEGHFENLEPGLRAKFMHRHYSATSLPRSAREAQLVSRHNDEIEIDPLKCGFRLFGHLVHDLLEIFADPGDIVERRVGVEVGGVYIHGQADRYVPGELALEDWKVTSAYSLLHDDKPAYIAQLNILAYLFRQNGMPVESLKLRYVLRDHRAAMVQEGSHYPKTMFPHSEVPLWSDDQVFEYICDRIFVHEEAKKAGDDELPFCSDEERWIGGPKFKAHRLNKDGDVTGRAAHSSGSKLETEDWIAAKVKEASASHRERERKRIAKLKNPEKAQAKPFDPPQFVVVEEKPEPTKCSYCDGLRFCNQRRAELAFQEG